MKGTVQINNCGVYTTISKSELCALLLKNSPRYYTKYPKMFDTEIDLLISKLQDAIGIQIYKTGVVRLFFEHGHFEERQTLYLLELSEEILQIFRGNLIL